MIRNINLSLLINSVQVTFRGTYRRVLQKPKNMSFKIEKYTDEKLPLFLHDIPVRRRDEPEKVEEKKEEPEKAETETETKENEAKNGEATETVKPAEEKKPGKFCFVIHFLIFRHKWDT